ncbi:PH domain-containing protein [Microdochium nivale]|nr:PH domain-containing protein [Microdochium nivale]
MPPSMQHGEDDATVMAATGSEPTSCADVPVPAQTTTPAKSIARSMSRYRKRAGSTTARAGVQPQDAVATSLPLSSHAAPPLPPLPTIPPQHALAQPGVDATASRHASSGTGINGTTASPPPVAASSRPPPPRLHERQPLATSTPSTPSSRQTSAEHGSRSRSGTRNAAPNRQRTNSDESGSRSKRHEEEPHHAQSLAHVASQPEPATVRSKKDVAPLQLQMLPIREQAPQPSQLQKSPVIEKFASLTKIRKPTTSHAPKSGFQDKAQDVHNSPSVGIISGGKGIVPQTDAPASAINTADQIVAVRCRGNRFLLDVDADTTIVEIVAKCARLVNDRDITVSNCVVLELYESLGLERRVRQFEAIRDIINSWDLDSQNCLVVKFREAGDSANDVDPTTIAKSIEPPKGCQIYMYHSNRPGKWNKRHITLLDNGQIICSKKPDAHAGDKDSMKLCRLSDYDIYQPSESEMRRHLKAPKRHCFAIRSQQKTTVFLNTDNYVQYFSVDDPEQAVLFQRKVDAWRTWCLLDRRPEPRKESIASPPRTSSAKKEDFGSSPTSLGRHTSRRSVNLSDRPRPRTSVDGDPYAISEYKPLLDLSFSDKRLSLFGGDKTGSPIISTDLTKPSRNSLVGRGLIDTTKVDDGFTGNGLLGNNYEERREAANQEVTEQAATNNGPQAESNAFASGPTLLNSQGLSHQTSPTKSGSWFPSALEHTAKHYTAQPTSSNDRSDARKQTIADGSGNAFPGSDKMQYHKSGRAHGPQSGQHRSREAHPPSGTSHSQMQRGRESRGAAQQPSRREQPKPLLDIGTPTANGPPQWKRKGHGVKAPDGLEHLVDFITSTDATQPDAHRGVGMLDAPARNSRRPSPSGASAPAHAALDRARSQSHGAGSGRAGVAVAPPMPPLPGRSHTHAGEDHRRSRGDAVRDREREKQRRKEQERAYREKEAAFNAVPGRNGTLKVV